MSRWSDSLSKKFQVRGKSKSKYGAKKVSRDGYSFSSKGEAAMHAQLLLEEKAGLISDIQVQDHVYLTDARILYIADFKVMDLTLNEVVWVEFKGLELDVWKIKKRLWKHYGPGRLRIFKRAGGRIVLTEELIPKQKVPTQE